MTLKRQPSFVGIMLLTAAPMLACDPKSYTPLDCATDTDQHLMACVNSTRYTDEVAAIAMPREPGSDNWQSVQDLCARKMIEYGYQVERHEYGTGVNVIGQRTVKTSDKRVIVSAHYDGTPKCAGADDNASGVAALLEFAHVMATAKLGGTLVVACWDEEENGLLGSTAYALRMKGAGLPVTLAVVFEAIGYRTSDPDTQKLPDGFDQAFPDAAAQVKKNGNRGDFIAVIADENAGSFADKFRTRASAAGLPNIVAKVPESQKNSDQMAALRRSDHASFWDEDYPAMMLTDTAEYRNPHYHCSGGPDVPSDLDAHFTSQVIEATVGMVTDVLGVSK